jgi:uncharacterized spore protein YtfJ
VRYQWTQKTPATGTPFEFASPAAEWFIPTRLDVYCQTGPTGTNPAAKTIFTLYKAGFGAATGTTDFGCIVTAVAAPSANGAGSSATQSILEAVTDLVSEGQYLEIVPIDTGVTAAAAYVTVLLTGYTYAA